MENPVSEALLQNLKSIKADLNSLDEFTCPGCQEVFLVRARVASGVCGRCEEKKIREQKAVEARRLEVVKLLGGESIFEKTAWKNIRTEENAKAVVACNSFNHKQDNLFLWGEC